MKRATLLAGSCLCALVVSTAPALALMQVDTIAGDHPTAADIASMKRASSPILSPDGQLVVYTVRWAERDPDATPHDGDTTGGWSTQQQLFLADTQDDDVVQITFADKSASSPTWRPDGNAIAFRRNGVIHQLSLDGGEPEPIDTGAFTPGAFAFMPDGKSIAFLATPPLTDDEKEESWRAGGGFSYGEQWRSAQLCVVDLSTNEVRVVTHSHANIVAFTPSPDGSRFLIVTSPTAEPHDAFILHTARIIDAATGATETTLENKQAIIGQIAWSPNGKYVAYERDSGGLSLLNSLIVQSADGAQRWNAAKKLDPSLAGFAWGSDSRTLIAHVLDRTRSTLYRLSRDGSNAAPMDFDQRVITGALSSSADGSSIAFLGSNDQHPPDPTLLNIDTGWWRTIAHVNPQTKDWSLASERVVRWKNREGVEIEGLLLTPAAAREGEPTPLLVLPHGGPDSVSTQAWNTWGQYFAARGFAVLRPNYRGSFGYGFDFYAANRGRLGQVEFMDIESGVDQLIRDGVVDANRMAYAGWSWGGFTTAYTLTHTNRYKAAVVGAGISDTANQYALSDINHGDAAKWEYTGNPWNKPRVFDRASAIRSAVGATTPTLIIHGQNDPRVPFVQGIALYRALTDVGCEVKFLAYPREPHGFREPAHVAHMLSAWARWCQSRVGLAYRDD